MPELRSVPSHCVCREGDAFFRKPLAFGAGAPWLRAPDVEDLAIFDLPDLGTCLTVQGGFFTPSTALKGIKLTA